MTRYELLDRIGVGGMAEIFRGKAVAAGGFEKPVAIKRILPHLSQDKRFVELLIAEAKVLSLLKHRNIVQIFDVGLGDDGQYFLVMEYVDGKDLGAVQRGLETRRKKIAFDLALHVVAEICEALEHAHTARAPDGKPMALVHRDVSPSNVLLSRAGEIKLTDFGIAKRAEAEQTGHGAVRGKFAYISPEQARNEQIGPRSDVFSVGILLWELVCNRRLFSGLGDLEALRAVREPTTIQRPSEVDPRIGTEVDNIVMAALSRERDKRPTAGQLGQMLRGLRYSLEQTVGDPASELAKVIETAEQVERQSVTMDTPPTRGSAGGFDSMDAGEMTVIRIRTADAFSRRDDKQSMSMARQVIDRFEEEETRLAQLSGDQLRMLRQGQRRDGDSAEMPTVTPPRPDARAPELMMSSRSRRQTEEPTFMRAPLTPVTDDAPTIAPINQSYDPDENTRLVVSRDRRTPVPERVERVDRGDRSERWGASSNAQPRPPGPPPGPARVLPGMGPPPQPLPPPPSPPPGMAMNTPGMAPMPLRSPPPPGPSIGRRTNNPFGGEPQNIPSTMPMSPVLVPPRDAPVGMPGFPAPEQSQMMPGFMQQPPQQPYPGWGVPQPAQQMSYAQQQLLQPQPPQPQPPPPPPPQVAGFGAVQPTSSLLKPWMLVVGAMVMALLAFYLTRHFINS